MRISDSGLRNTIQIVMLALVLVFPVLAHAAKVKQPEIVLSPKKVGPGDIAIVTLKNASGPVEGSFNNKPLHFNPVKNGYQAIVGIDLYLEPGDYPLQVTMNGKDKEQMMKIVKKKYPLQRLTLAKDKVELSPESEARVEFEQKKTAAIWPGESERHWKGPFVNPMPGKKLGTPFGVRRIINDIPKSSHTGVDLTADEGDEVKAPNAGIVALVDDLFFSGNSVILDHGQGIYTMFFHLSKITVQQGQAVSKGDVVGLVGSTGRASGAHLHWGVRIQGARVDPLQLIKLKIE